MKDSKASTVLFIGAGASAPIGFPTTKQVMERIGFEPFDPWKQKEVTKYNETLVEIYNNLPQGYKDLEGILDYLRTANEEMSSHHLDILTNQLSINLSEELSRISKELEECLLGLGPTEMELLHGSTSSIRSNPIKFIRNFVAMHKEKSRTLEEDLKQYMFNLYAYQPEIHDNKLRKIYRPLIISLINDYFKEGVNELPIFTTNYDLVFENLNRSGLLVRYHENEETSTSIRLVDGFEIDSSNNHVFSVREYEKSYNEPVIKLFKLHGGLNWWNRKEDNRIIQFPRLISPLTDPNYEGPVVIYPAGYGPYPRDEFHMLHNYFERYLTNAKRCIIIGFSFRDIGRINHIFDDVMKDSNRQLKIIISDIKANIDELKEVKALFGRYEGRYEYYSGGIEELPKMLEGNVKKVPQQTQETQQKVDKTPKEPI